MSNLTCEQRLALEAFSKERLLKVNAFAGTGKTTTLLEMANSSKERGIYLAFNRAIADEVKAKSANSKLDARTTHSLALSSFRNKGYSSDKLTTNIQGNRIAHDLDFVDLSLDGKVTLTARALGFIVNTCLTSFCQSSENRPTRKHVRLFGKMSVLSPMYQLEFQDYIVKMAGYLWERMIDPSDAFPLGHDGYLKLWSLSSPQIPFSYILLDEAQDTNEAVLSVLLSQTNQVVFVGDKHQQIYEWRGAINAMSKVKGAFETQLTQTFRFGSEIAKCANVALGALEEQLPLRGNTSVSSLVQKFGETSTLLSRTNAGVLESIIKLHKKGNTVHVFGGTLEIRMLLEDVERLKKNYPATTNDLFGFESWKEVCEFSETDEGEFLRAFVKLVESHGEQFLLQELSRCVEIPRSDTKFVSTAHKAKGREWDSVELNADFLLSRESDGAKLGNNEETRLLYVSVTRAKRLLVLPDNLYQILLPDNLSSPSNKQSLDSRLTKHVVINKERAAPQPSPPKFVKRLS